MKFRFASWNVNNRSLASGHLKLLRDMRPDILAVQESSARFHEALAGSDLFHWSAFSLVLRPCKKGEGRSRRLGCSLFGRQEFALLQSSVIRRLAFPERTLVARLERSGVAVTVCSFHTPPGASWGEVKPRTLKAIALWLSRQSGPVIFGIDANCPKTDHPEIARTEWWWDDESMLLGQSPIHGLKDSLRVYLEANPHEFAQLVAARPDGPLAISHVRGKRGKMTPCRYDFIYVTPDVRVSSVVYVFDDTTKRLSDHALVIADLEVEDRPANDNVASSALPGHVMQIDMVEDELASARRRAEMLDQMHEGKPATR